MVTQVEGEPGEDRIKGAKGRGSIQEEGAANNVRSCREVKENEKVPLDLAVKKLLRRALGFNWV